jgi:D-3-phosphoglycerate dehydrogenase / 2-oxoglutarate reductase
MHKILTLNNISAAGLNLLPREQYEVASEFQNPDAILLRSFKMHDMPIPSNLKAVGRAGSGVNNIPVSTMSERGIAVFNAPGANANAVKELVLAGMLIASRNICQAVDYTRQLSGDDATIAKDVEAGKKAYAGVELPGRTLGVIGLGAIGVQIANAAKALGMRVLGFDPAMTVQSAWKLDAGVEARDNIDMLLQEVDYVTFHVPLVEGTRNLINADRLSRMKDGAVILNFARGGIIDDDAVLVALDSGKIKAYMCDFPTNAIKNHPNVVALPHLGASTVEAEDNCARMVAEQVRDYLEHGNVTNSVNFPDMSMPRTGEGRLSIVNANVPNMVGQVSSVLADSGHNIIDLLNRSRDNLAYNLVDVSGVIGAATVERLLAIDGVLAVRSL